MDDAKSYSAALYCSVCPLKEACGGLHCKASPLSCLEYCCGLPDGCTTVCPRNPAFIDQIAEVGGFDLGALAIAAGPPVMLNQKIVPMIYHGSKRTRPFLANTVALRLSDVINFRHGICRFHSREQLCAEFKLDPRCRIVLSGVDHDPVIERLWSLGVERFELFRTIALLGIACATTPNFSMVLDVPRSDNLHSMQRIAIIYSEMSSAGLPTALHVNGRTDYDFERWARFLQDHKSINALSYEFITGSGLDYRRNKHGDWLNGLIADSGRDVHLIIRGNPESLTVLDSKYTLTYIETTSFVKAINRQESVRSGNAKLIWNTSENADAFDVSGALEHTVHEVSESLSCRYPVLG
jgi:hypothetical protein